jgi:hypothetical protein
MQYRAIFSDYAIEQSDATDNDEGLLSAWMYNMNSQLFAALEKYLPTITEGQLLSNIQYHWLESLPLLYILGQCMWYGSSLGARYGIDFRSQIVGLFEQVITTLFVTNLSSATKTLFETLKNYKYVALQKQKSVLHGT